MRSGNGRAALRPAVPACACRPPSPPLSLAASRRCSGTRRDRPAQGSRGLPAAREAAVLQVVAAAWSRSASDGISPALAPATRELTRSLLLPCLFVCLSCARLPASCNAPATILLQALTRAAACSNPPPSSRSDWLSNEWEADIEELEVNSSQTPLRKQQAALAAAATAAASPAAGGTCNYVEWQPWQQADGGFVEGPPSSGDGASRWGSSEVGDELMPWDNPSPDRQRRRAPPLLPGLPLVANSPQPPAPVVPPSPPHQRQLAPPQGEPLHTLFDLAGMDMSDLL